MKTRNWLLQRILLSGLLLMVLSISEITDVNAGWITYLPTDAATVYKGNGDAVCSNYSGGTPFGPLGKFLASGTQVICGEMGSFSSPCYATTYISPNATRAYLKYTDVSPGNGAFLRLKNVISVGGGVGNGSTTNASRRALVWYRNDMINDAWVGNQTTWDNQPVSCSAGNCFNGSYGVSHFYAIDGLWTIWNLSKDWLVGYPGDTMGNFTLIWYENTTNQTKLSINQPGLYAELLVYSDTSELTVHVTVNGIPRGGQIVRLFDAGGSLYSSLITLSSGDAVFHNIPYGDYTINVTHETQNAVVTKTLTNPTELVNINFFCAECQGSTEGSYAGTVTLSDNTPAYPAYIYLVGPDDSICPSTGPCLASTDANGFFNITGLKIGWYYGAASYTGYTSLYDVPRVIDGPTVHDFIFLQQTTTQLNVTTYADIGLPYVYQPLSGVIVSAVYCPQIFGFSTMLNYYLSNNGMGCSIVKQQTSNASGKVIFNIPKDTYPSLVVVGEKIPGYSRDVKQVTLGSQDHADLDLVLKQSASYLFRVSVVDYSNTNVSIQNATVQLSIIETNGGIISYLTTTDAGGHANFTVRAPSTSWKGALYLAKTGYFPRWLNATSQYHANWVIYPDYVNSLQSYVLVTGKLIPGSVNPDSTYFNISGYVTDGSDNPVSGVTLSLTCRDNNGVVIPGYPYETEDDGFFIYQSIPKGLYCDVGISVQDSGTTTLTPVCASGTTCNRNIFMSGDKEINFTTIIQVINNFYITTSDCSLVDEPQTPISGVKVHVRDILSGSVHTPQVTDGSGLTTISLGNGQYLVYAESIGGYTFGNETVNITEPHTWLTLCGFKDEYISTIYGRVVNETITNGVTMHIPTIALLYMTSLSGVANPLCDGITNRGDGNFECAAPPGDYIIWASWGRLRSNDVRIFVPNTQNTAQMRYTLILNKNYNPFFNITDGEEHPDGEPYTSDEVIQWSWKTLPPMLFILVFVLFTSSLTKAFK